MKASLHFATAEPLLWCALLFPIRGKNMDPVLHADTLTNPWSHVTVQSETERTSRFVCALCVQYLQFPGRLHGWREHVVGSCTDGSSAYSKFLSWAHITTKFWQEALLYQSRHVGDLYSFASIVYRRYTLSIIISPYERCRCLGGVYLRSPLWTNVQNSRNRAYNPIANTQSFVTSFRTNDFIRDRNAIGHRVSDMSIWVSIDISTSRGTRLDM